MTISELCDKAVQLLEIVAKKSVKHSGEATQIIEELTRLKGWAYPHLATDDVVRVVRCKRCKHYKKYKKKDDRKAVPFYACSLTMAKRDPEFYCKEGREP